ncbi:MAG TPA: ATP-binding protein [Chloroflexota bacterium]
MRPTDIRRLLAQGEDNKLDFKSELRTATKDQKAAFVKDVIALTNSPPGNAYLVVGIDDITREPVLGNHVDSMETIDRVITQYVQPVVRITAEPVDLDGVPVTVLTPHREPQKLPYAVKKTVGGGTQAIEVDEWWVRHGRLNARPTVEEARAIFFEAERARSRSPRTPRQRAPDDYSPLSSASRRRRMAQDLMDAMNARSLAPFRGMLREVRADRATGQLRTEKLQRQPANALLQFPGSEIILLPSIFDDAIDAEAARYWHIRNTRLSLRLGSRASPVTPVRVMFVHGRVSEAALKRMAENWSEAAVFSMDCGVYVGPDLSLLSLASEWAKRMALGYTSYAPTICVPNVRNATDIGSALDCTLSWIDEHLPLAEMRTLIETAGRQEQAELLASKVMYVEQKKARSRSLRPRRRTSRKAAGPL